MMGDLNRVLYQDPIIRLRQTSGTKYRLSIEFALSGFSFCIKSQDGKKALALGNYRVRYKGSYLRVLQEMIQAFECDRRLCELRFEQVELLFADTAFTVLPVGLFDEKNRTHYLDFSANKQTEYSVSHRQIDSVGAVCVFEFFGEALEYWLSKAERVGINHSLFAFAQCAVLDPKYVLHIQMRDDWQMDVAALKNAKLELITTFCAVSKEDFIYSLLLVCNQLGLDNKKTKILLYGSSEIAMKLKNDLDKYFPLRDLASRNTEIEFSSALDFVTPWEYHTIINSL